ncbi:hypothetical protein DLAC_05148 [Tieghemostelium lacteum]|uniref:Uncharacterized protein n=1 Tax=Tieghemostelium lacteum TaxID=361077 RepID=A0A151ZID6_TIELA|nr:hypothetical protein DLAC_05148 [Tieghemostelium lacteum]|eukprot:KYQ93758.1 hypothetical protein DLAC_05148 [Tieghemostelium lacteum]
MSNNLAKITAIASVASVFAYYANSLYRQYGEYVSGESAENDNMPPQFRGQAGLSGRRKPQASKKPSINDRLNKELNELYVSGQLAIEEENYSLALSIFERMLEISEDNPSIQQGKAQALSHLFKIATQLNNPELTIKYAEKIIEFFGKPTSSDQLKEILKFHEILIDRLVAIDKIHQAISTIKTAIKKYKLSDTQMAEQYSILATIYQAHSSFTNNEEQLDTIEKSINYAKKSGDSKLQINAIFDLFYFFVQENRMEEAKVAQNEIETLLPQLSSGYFKSSSDILYKFDRYEQFIEQRERFITFIKENPSEMSMEKVSLENLLNGLIYETAAAHNELGHTEKALEVLNQVKDSEYFSYSPNTKSKHFQVTKATFKNSLIKMHLKPRSTPSEMTQDQKDGLLVCTISLDQEDKPEPLQQEQPFSQSMIKFKFDSADLDVKKPYLAKFEYFNKDKTELFSTFYQLIAPQEPQHPLPTNK